MADIPQVIDRDRIRTMNLPPDEPVPGTPPINDTSLPKICSDGYVAQQVWDDAKKVWRAVAPCKEGYEFHQHEITKRWYCCKKVLPPTGCTSDQECIDKYGPGWKCVDGKCKKTTADDTDTTTECPEGKGKAYEGCPCGEAYGTKTGECAPGYKYVQRAPWTGNKDGVVYSEGMIGTCHCQKAVDDWKAKKGGEFKFSPEVQALLNRILERANMLLDQPLGLSEEERQAIYNRIYEKIKGTEKPAIQSQMDVLSRQGLLGTPYAERSITGIQRGTREALGGAERDIEINEAQQRYEQLMGITNMVQSLYTTGMSTEQIVEALNAGRRGEGQNARQMLLNYFSMLYGGQNNAYWQAIINRLLNPGQSG